MSEIKYGGKGVGDGAGGEGIWIRLRGGEGDRLRRKGQKR